MAYKSPSVPVVPNPVFMDKAIAEIQTHVGNNVNWLSYAFGRAYPKVEFRSGIQQTKPFVYKGSKEYLPVQFNDNLQAQSFFVMGNQSYINEFDSNLLNFVSADCGLVVWANLKKINSTKGDSYYYAEQLKYDVRWALTNAFFKWSNIIITEIVENTTDVLSEFDFTEDDLQYFSYPYVAFRFNFTLQVKEECLSEAPITP